MAQRNKKGGWLGCRNNGAKPSSSSVRLTLKSTRMLMNTPPPNPLIEGSVPAVSGWLVYQKLVWLWGSHLIFALFSFIKKWVGVITLLSIYFACLFVCMFVRLLSLGVCLFVSLFESNKCPNS